MTKFSLVVNSDDPKEIANALAYFMGTTSVPQLTIQNNASGDADDNAPPNLNAPQFDASGIPWDDRIHSKNKAMTNDGMWRKKRGVADTTVAAVEMELKARGAQAMYMPPNAPPPTYQPPAPPPQNYAPPPPTYQPPAPPPQNYAPPNYQPPPPNYQPPPTNYAPPAPVGPMDFTQFMQHITAQLPKRDANNQPIMDGNYLASVCQRLSAQMQRPFSAITDLANHPDCIALAVQFIQADGRW